MNKAKVFINVLPANEGDCIIITIRYGDIDYNIMVDSGSKSTYRYPDRKKRIVDGALKKTIEELRANGQIINLLILTHVDDDHIGGLVEWIAKDEEAFDMIDWVFLNNGEKVTIPDYSSRLHSIPKGRKLNETLRAANKCVENKIVKGCNFDVPHGHITILTPTVAAHNIISDKWAAKKVLNKVSGDYNKPIKDLLKHKFDSSDFSKTNNSSISFILEVDGRKDLFLGDADVEDVCLALEELEYSKECPLCCTTVKLSHHGSRNNFSERLLDLVRTEVFIFSSNGNYHGHPDKEVFAYIIDKTSAKVYFNYVDRAKRIICNQDLIDYPSITNRILDNLNG